MGCAGLVKVRNEQQELTQDGEGGPRKDEAAEIADDCQDGCEIFTVTLWRTCRPCL